jgi:hypothetical protein
MKEVKGDFTLDEKLAGRGALGLKVFRGEFTYWLARDPQLLPRAA